MCLAFLAGKWMFNFNKNLHIQVLLVKNILNTQILFFHRKIYQLDHFLLPLKHAETNRNSNPHHVRHGRDSNAVWTVINIKFLSKLCGNYYTWWSLIVCDVMICSAARTMQEPPVEQEMESYRWLLWDYRGESNTTIGDYFQTTATSRCM